MGVNVGTELRQILQSLPIGIRQVEGCGCLDMEAKMNGMGLEWCQSPDGMEEILSQLRKAAAERGLPFIDAAGRMLVRRAIKNARRAGLGPAA
jgi:hypothetical protein